MCTRDFLDFQDSLHNQLECTRVPTMAELFYHAAFFGIKKIGENSPTGGEDFSRRVV